MDNADLRPSLPWRRVMPGTYAAETPTGETYLVERTDEGWRVVLRGPRGGREVLGEPSRIKWVGQCRAENHYLHASKGRKAAAPEAKPPRKPEPRKPPVKAAQARTPAAAGRKRGEAKASRRHRRPAPAKAAKPAKPEKPAAPAEPLPPHTLAWKVSQRNGREFHVAEHADGLFKIIEVKGTEGFALFSEPKGGVVQEIQCGSLDACKQVAASMQTGKAGKRKTKADASATAEKAPRSASKKKSGASFTPTPFSGTHAPPGPDPEAVRKLDGKAADSNACGCDPPKSKPRAPLDEAKQAKLVEGLRSALRKVKPAAVEA
jgi:hypothetical protein